MPSHGFGCGSAGRSASWFFNRRLSPPASIQEGLPAWRQRPAGLVVIRHCLCDTVQNKMASKSVNKVILLGHLGKDAETKFTPNGTARTTFSLATNRRWKDQATGEWKDETD